MFNLFGHKSLQTAPYVHEYFGHWCITPEGAQALYHAAMSLNLRRHLAAKGGVTRQRANAHRMADGDDEPSYYNTSVSDDGIAVVRIAGTLMKQASSLGNDSSTVLLRQTMRGLARDPGVAGVMLVIESPGGTVAGTMDLAADIAALAAVKPTHAYADGLMASAAYWVGSQAAVISAGPDAIIGSIGTFATVYDFSGAVAKDGIKVYVIREGEFKGMGVPGTEITPEQRAELQRTVTALNDHFLGGVSAGRKVSAEQAKSLNDGRVHVGQAAKDMGLIDFVEGLDAAMTRLRGAVAAKTIQQSDGPKAVAEPPATAGVTTEDQQMAGTNDGTAADQAERNSEPHKTPESQAAAPATTAQVDESCPGASSDFKLECLRQNMTVSATKDAFIGWQATQLRARDEDATKAGEAHAAALKAKDDQIADLQQKLDAMPRGNAAASFQAESKAGQTAKPAKSADGNLTYGDGTKVGEGNALAIAAAATKMPGADR